MEHMIRDSLFITHLVAALILSLLLPLVVVAQTEDFAEILRQQLASEEVAWAEQELAWAQLREFYAPHYRPVWFNEQGLSARARHWRQTLRAAEVDGLDPERYHLSNIEQYWAASMPVQQVWLELLLTDAFFHYSIHLRNGRLDPVAIDPNWHIDTAEVNAVSLLRNTLAAESFAEALHDLPPPHLGYQQLREALGDYRALAKVEDWPVLPLKPKLYWGMWHDNVRLLRRRLVLSGDLLPTPVLEARFFDQSLKQAVERFQLRHGLKVDGVMGAATVASMNTPISEHIKQIKLNMERWRWLPRQLDRRYIMVNTASYRLHVIDKQKPRLAMRVITGTPERPTPVVGGVLRNLIINPYWFVPKKIALEDLIPKQLRDPDFFKTKHIRVLSSLARDAQELDPSDIDWSKLTPDNFPYVLRQDPGPANSLGTIKFPFLNNFAIYLHDTPQQQLFKQSSRAFSSGCIRVEQPLQLARYLLNGEQGWSLAKLQEKIATGESLTIRLPKPISIYLVYWTVWVGADKAVYFQKDIYGRDRPMADCH